MLEVSIQVQKARENLEGCRLEHTVSSCGHTCEAHGLQLRNLLWTMFLALLVACHSQGNDST